MSSTHLFNLEPRQLLSGSGKDRPTMPDPATSEAAKQAVMVDYQQLLSHVETNRAAVTAARQTLKDHQTEFAAQLKTLEADFRADQKAISTAEKAAQVAKSALKAQWAPIVHADQLDVDTVSEGETEEEQAADLAKL